MTESAPLFYRHRKFLRLTAVFMAIMGLAWLASVWNASALDSTYANVEFVSATTNDLPGTIDPGYTKDVAECIATRLSGELVNISITNGYPSYTCTFEVVALNSGRLEIMLNPLTIEAPPVLTVTDITDNAGIQLGGGARDTERFSVHVEQQAQQGATYTFTIRKPFRLHHEGTIGFWRNWNSHNTFTKAQIEGWLSQIDTASAWYGPTTTDGMVSLMNAALRKNATPRDKFLAHCLATRLNLASGILDGPDLHNVTGADPGNYLGLSNPSAASLTSVIAAIESKYGTSLNNTKYNTMKNVCDGLNNLLF
jgi:hypothetical protein